MKKEGKGETCEKKLQCQNEEESEEREGGKEKRKKTEESKDKRGWKKTDPENGEKRMREYVS